MVIRLVVIAIFDAGAVGTTEVTEAGNGRMDGGEDEGEAGAGARALTAPSTRAGVVVTRVVGVIEEAVRTNGLLGSGDPPTRAACALTFGLFRSVSKLSLWYNRLFSGVCVGDMYDTLNHHSLARVRCVILWSSLPLKHTMLPPPLIYVSCSSFVGTGGREEPRYVPASPPIFSSVATPPSSHRSPRCSPLPALQLTTARGPAGPGKTKPAVRSQAPRDVYPHVDASCAGRHSAPATTPSTASPTAVYEVHPQIHSPSHGARLHQAEATLAFPRC